MDKKSVRNKGNLISQFVTSVKSDIDSPITSNFGNRIADYKSQVGRFYLIFYFICLICSICAIKLERFLVISQFSLSRSFLFFDNYLTNKFYDT